jgi:hypothetical protein
MKHGVDSALWRWAHFAVPSVVALALAPLGCSSKTASGPACDPSQCAAGNDCIDDGSGPSCHRVCTAQSDCPFGWYCNDGATGSQGKNWCVQNTIAVTPGAMGEWGASCQPSKGIDNPACDGNDGFGCYGVSPTDANAFCTIYDCAQDSDCPGGWWCATVDKAPNVTTTKRTWGQTRTVCLPRSYCAPCQEDHDCAPAPNGTAQHCVPDAQGNGFCAPECAGNANCALDAACKHPWALCMPAQGATCKSDDDCPPSNGIFQHCQGGQCTGECGSDSDCTGAGQSCQKPLAVCMPRAGVCVGDGGFCSPCRSDADCKNGYCFTAAYSTERFCSAPTTSTCPTPSDGSTLVIASAGMCPAVPSGASAKQVACIPGKAPPPPDQQCLGLTTISDGNGGKVQIPGCWTVNR